MQIRCMLHACRSEGVTLFVMFDGTADGRWYTIGRSQLDVGGFIDFLLFL